MKEQLFREKKSKQRLRPFQKAAQVSCRGYSRRLERILVDFGSDESFADASKKVSEHYGIEISPTGIRQATYKHSHKMLLEERREKTPLIKPATKPIISQSDGTMVPIVEINKGLGDARKRRRVCWKEAISTLAYSQGSTTPVYAATMEGRDEAGFQMKQTAIESGMGKHTKIHAVGDGATWIAEKVEFHFGNQAHFLIDFYHLCDYLAAAVEATNSKNKKVYLGRLKSLMKQGKWKQALKWLKKFEEPQSTNNEHAPIRACLRYINNRPGQFEYHKAIDQELPIGSGVIESTHRHLIQKRLKLPGAWWKKENAALLLALRTVRANLRWEQYWNTNKAA